MRQTNTNLIDIDLERNALGVLVQSPEQLSKAQEILGKIGSEVFTSKERQNIYKAMLSLKEKGKPITLVTLRRSLNGQPEAREELRGLPEIAYSKTGALIETYSLTLKELASNRGFTCLTTEATRAITKGKDLEKVGQKLTEGLKELKTETKKEKIGLTALESLAAPNKESPSPVKGGICEPGRYTIVGATDGEGKTTLMLQFALCAITGTTFLGFFPIPKPVTVLYFCGENVKPDIDAKLTKQIAELEKLKGGSIAKYLENFIFVYPDKIEIQLDKEGGLAWLKARLQEYSPDIVIFDPLNEFVSSSTSLNDDTIARKAAKSLNKIAREFNCIPVITTHFRGEQKDQPESVFDKFHGSKYWVNPSVAQAAMYRANQQKYETAKYLEFKLKTVEAPPRILVMRDRDSLWYSETTPDEFSKAKLQPKHVLEILIRKFNGKAVPTIFTEVAAEELSCSQRQIFELVKLAVEQGLIKKEKGLYVPMKVKKRGKGKLDTKDLAGQETLLKN